jgi:hypothetical protein
MEAGGTDKAGRGRLDVKPVVRISWRDSISSELADRSARYPIT